MKRYGRLGQFFKTPTHCPVLGQNVFFVCSPVKKLPLLQPQLKHHKWFLSDAKKELPSRCGSHKKTRFDT